MSLTKNKVLDPANSLPTSLIQSYKQLPGSIKMTQGSVQNRFRLLYVSLSFNVG